MTDSPRVAILVNPERDHAADELQQALVRLDGRVDVERRQPDAPDAIEQTARSSVEAGFDVIAAIGGDGTQRSVAAAVAGTGTALGVVPGGTVNLLAQVLGIDDIDVAAAAIMSGRRRSIDVGRCNGTVFVLNASSGYDAAVIAEADQGDKARFGRLTFVNAAVKVFRRSRPQKVDVIVDGTTMFSGRAMSVIVTNVAERSSSDFVVAPDAVIDDGRLDVMIVRASTPLSSLRLLVALARDRDPRPSDLLRRAGARIDVRWADDVRGQIDGDPTEITSNWAYGVDRAALTVAIAPSDRHRQNQR